MSTSTVPDEDAAPISSIDSSSADLRRAVHRLPNLLVRQLVGELKDQHLLELGRQAAQSFEQGGALFVALAFHNLRARGRPTDAWEHTTVVIDSSVYGRIRHPMYAGTGIWATGIAMARPSAGSALLAAACVAMTLLAALAEDRYNLRKFGAPYAEYMRRVPLANVFRGRPPTTGTKG